MRRFLVALVAAITLLAPARSAGSAAAQELAFARGGNIWTIGADGKRARLLLRQADSPAWSPDGSRLAFVSGRSGDEEIYVANGNGTRVTRLTRSAGPDLSPAWSTDGRRLAFSRKAEIWTMSADGSAQHRLVRKTKVWHEHYSPTWHRAGIVYSSNRVSNFNAELFRVPARRLTFTKGAAGVLGDDGMPDYSPDGRRIVFTSNRDQQAEIYLMNPDGSGQKRLTRRSGDDWAPDFSPDGTQVAFTQLPGTIWLMKADGTRLRELTAGIDADWRP